MSALTAERVARLIADLTFSVPPRCQGQIVMHSYACDGDYIYERICDRSDRSETIVVYEHPDTESETDWDPWNEEPSVGDQVRRIQVGGAL